MKYPLSFEKIVNFRGFDDLKTRQNARIKCDRVFRSGLLDFATAKDLDLLVSIAPDTIIDFRMDGEKHNEKIKLRFSDLRYEPQPIEVGNFFSDDKVASLESLKATDIDRFFLKMYQLFPSCAADQFKTAFNAIVQNQRVIYHCSAGKDRTGVMSYLLLSALDVHYDDIMTNYLESNRYAEDLHQLFVENKKDDPLGVEGSGELAKVLQKVRYVDENYLNTLDQYLKTEFGGPTGYIEKVLNIDIESVKKVLLD